MASERFVNVYHDYVATGPTQVYSVPSGYSAVVKPVRMSNVAASSSTLTLYQGSGVAGRTVLKTEVSSARYAVENEPLVVSSGLPLFAAQTLASGIVLHLSAVEYPLN